MIAGDNHGQIIYIPMASTKKLYEKKKIGLIDE